MCCVMCAVYTVYRKTSKANKSDSLGGFIETISVIWEYKTKLAVRSDINKSAGMLWWANLEWGSCFGVLFAENWWYHLYSDE